MMNGRNDGQPKPFQSGAIIIVLAINHPITGEPRCVKLAYVELRITQNIFTIPLDFEIARSTCISYLY